MPRCRCASRLAEASLHHVRAPPSESRPPERTSEGHARRAVPARHCLCMHRHTASPSRRPSQVLRHLGVQHSVDQAREQLRLVGAVLPTSAAHDAA